MIFTPAHSQSQLIVPNFPISEFIALCLAGIYELQSGMLVEILKESTTKKAKSPRASDTCKVTYAGTLKDGTPFDSGTTNFAPNQVIKGWTEGAGKLEFL